MEGESDARVGSDSSSTLWDGGSCKCAGNCQTKSHKHGIMSLPAGSSAKSVLVL